MRSLREEDARLPSLADKHEEISKNLEDFVAG
jgi:uncharacterized protein YdcH (DUF465 family)